MEVVVGGGWQGPRADGAAAGALDGSVGVIQVFRRYIVFSEKAITYQLLYSPVGC